MNLYLISQTVNNNYDTYDAFVVCAEDEHQARVVHDFDTGKYGSWVSNKEDVKVKLLGVADDSIGYGEILGSFNAG